MCIRPFCLEYYPFPPSSPDRLRRLHVTICNRQRPEELDSYPNMNTHNETSGPVLHPSMLPSTADKYFRDTSFFIQNASLPSPDEVRIAAGPPSGLHRPGPVVFPPLNLIVKYGASITIAEGQCLWAIRHLLPSVPVPEAYGWCRDQNETFIYMQLIEGITLENAWPDLDTEGRYQVCQQLEMIFRDLRQLKQTPNSPFIGK
jgi:hypothetical protein